VRKSIDRARSQAEVVVDNTPVAEAISVPAPEPSPQPAHRPAAAPTSVTVPKMTPAAPAPALTAKDNAPVSSEGPISKADIDLVQHSFLRFEPIYLVVGRTFYERLFETNPEIRKLFTDGTESQGERFIDMTGAAVTGLDDLEALLPVVRQLGARHRKYGVETSHYGAFAEVLI
jgi:hypothetical protein